MSCSAIDIKQLCKVYRGKKLQKVEALQTLDLHVEEGGVFGFLGPNGAGKSTTIKILTGQIKATAGRAFIFGNQVFDCAARQRMGYLPENPSFYDFMTADEYLLFVGRIFRMTTSELKRAIDQVLDTVNLTVARERTLKTYSKGMVQRLGLAQTLLHDPDLYILDEPMSGLDPVGRALVKDIIIDLKRRGKTVFFSTHITNDVETTCDQFAILNKGHLLVSDSVRNILDVESNGGYVIYSTDSSGNDLVSEARSDELSNILRDLQDKGMNILHVQQKRQTLEDYFLSLVDRDNSCG